MGIDNIDVESCTKAGVLVMNTPGMMCYWICLIQSLLSYIAHHFVVFP